MTMIELYPDFGLPENVCPTCNGEYKNRKAMETHHAKTHNTKISYAIIRCDSCGHILRRKRGGAKRNDSHYCDSDCLGDARHGKNNPAWSPRVDVNCAVCDTDLERTWWQVEKTEVSFCSDECNAEWLAEHLKGENHTAVWSDKFKYVDCDWCGGEIRRHISTLERNKRNFCNNDCQSAWQDENWEGEDSPAWKETSAITRRIYYGDGWPEKRKAVIERDGSACVGCGISRVKHLERHGVDLHVHHRVPIAEFESNGSVDYERANRETNLVTLCSSCHRKWESLPIQIQVET